MTTPMQFLREAITAVPAVKYALGIGGIVATVAIIYSFKIDPRVAFVGTVVMLVLMGILVVFARMASIASATMLLPALVFTWFVLLIFIALSISLFTSVFYQKPLDLSYWLTGKSQASVLPPEPIRLTADSSWREGGSSPDQYCGEQKSAYEKQYAGKTVDIVDKKEDHKAEYTPFKRDYYRYQCWFVVK